MSPANNDTIILELMRDPSRLSGNDLRDISARQWKEILESARDQRCLRYISWVLRNGDGPELPQDQQRNEKRWCFRALSINRECVSIHKLLAREKIEHVFLKGVPLAFRNYPHSWLRPMRDIDLLVPRGQLDDGYEILLRAGGPIDVYRYRDTTAAEDGKHLPPVHAPHRTVPVELHYRIAHRDRRIDPDGLELLHRQLWQERQGMPLGGVNLPVPSPEVMLVHLLIHGLFDHELNNGPLFVTDMMHLIRSQPIDAKRLSMLVEALSIEAAMPIAAALLPETDRAPFAPWMRRQSPGAVPDRSALDTLLLQPSHTRSDVKLSATLAKLTMRDRLLLVIGKFFPGRAAMQTHWTLTKGTAAPMPRQEVVLWLWFASVRIRQIATRAPGSLSAGPEASRRESLIALRASLSPSRTQDNG